MKMMDANEIISVYSKSEKKTPVKVYIKRDLKEVTFPETVQAFVNKNQVYYSENGLKLRQFLMRIISTSLTTL